MIDPKINISDTAETARLNTRLIMPDAQDCTWRNMEKRIIQRETNTAYAMYASVRGAGCRGIVQSWTMHDVCIVQAVAISLRSPCLWGEKTYKFGVTSPSLVGGGLLKPRIVEEEEDDDG